MVSTKKNIDILNVKNKLLNRNSFLIIALFPFLFTLLIFIFQQNILKSAWGNEMFKVYFPYVGVGFMVLLFFSWVFIERRNIFSQKFHFRQLITVLAFLYIFIFFYLYKSLVYWGCSFFSLAILYGFYTRKIDFPKPAIILLFIYLLLQWIGLSWNAVVLEEFRWVLTDLYIPLFAVVAICFFRPTTREVTVFSSFLLKFGLLFLIWHSVSYLFVVSSVGKNLFACFVFDKGYLSPVSYYETIRFSVFNHPSVIAWIMIIIGGVGYASFRKDNQGLISCSELVTYWIFLLGFVFIVQARVGQLGYFIVLAGIFYFEYLTKLSKNKRITLLSIGGLLFLLGVYYIVAHTSFFTDPIRVKMYQISFESIAQHPWFGSGTLSQINLLKNAGFDITIFHHMHNDFVMALIQYGILGLLIFCSWIFMMIRSSFINKDLRMFFFMLPTLLIMLTDSAFFYSELFLFTSVFIFMLFEPQKNQKYANKP